MLSSNLVYTSKKYNTKKNKIAIIGEELYGANITASFGISGNTESFIFFTRISKSKIYRR
ncbi:MAG: hypothetical protein L6V81_00615 [Clostridium sp.]|nr:MAG: hypothetical protein L6V81_00615 [Clostridium sp.]